MSALRKLAFGAAISVLAFAAASEAAAQSTGTQAVEQVVVTARRDTVPSIGGVIVRETEPKDRSTITNQYLLTQTPGQSIIASLNLVPGLNFTNTDAYGASGGNLRIHGFDGNRIGLTWDGMPLNDTGNYAIYTNQQGDPEVVSQVQVNLGATDVDSPTASAAGGLINYVTRLPGSKPGMWLGTTYGDQNFKRFFGLVDSGRIGPFGTSSFASVSFQEYNKFKGPGELKRLQLNGRVYQPVGQNGDFMSVAVHYNENRNAFYRSLSKAQVAQFGYGYDNNPVFINPTFTTGEIDLAPAANTNFYGVRVNPSNTGNIRGQSRFSITDKLRVTIDPFFQYVLANGGGYNAFSETDGRLVGAATIATRPCRVVNATTGVATTQQRAGVDLNGDGDFCDTVGVYSPNTTNTRRYGVSSSLIYDLNATNRFRIAYSLDYGRHRQTGEYSPLNAGFPQNVFGGKDGYGPKIFAADGTYVRGRDRFSIAELNQVAGEYRGSFLTDRLIVLIGVRAPFFRRELNQYCFSQSGSAFNVDCTPAAAIAAGVFAGGLSATNYVVPYHAEFKYDKVLPNVGATFKLTEDQSVYASFAQNLSAPRTDDLYTVVRRTSPTDFTYLPVRPETSDSYNGGYRFQSQKLLVQLDGYLNQFQNRIATSFDQDLGFSVSRNVGDVQIYGFDLQAAWRPIENLSIFGSTGYTHAELQNDVTLGRTTAGVPIVLPTTGKRLVETPEWTVAGRAEYRIADFTVGFQGKWVDDRFTTDINDDVSPSYAVFDADASVTLARFGFPGVLVRATVSNLFDEQYFGNISTQSYSVAIPSLNLNSPSTPNFSIGAPRTATVSLQARF